MSTETATLALLGNVFLDDFAKAVQCLHKLMDALSQEVVGEKLAWEIDELEHGSAMITLSAPNSGKVIQAFSKVGRSLKNNNKFPYGDSVRTPALRLCGLMNGRITSIRFETRESDSQIFSKPVDDEQQEMIQTYGSVEGRIQSLSNRGRLRFTIYEREEDRPVSVYLSDGCEDVMRDSWGKMAAVEGMVRRDPTTGTVLTIRDVQRSGVRLFDAPLKYTWRDAIGCCPAPKNSISSEEAISLARERGISSVANPRNRKTEAK